MARHSGPRRQRGRRRSVPKVALRLAKALGTTAQLWLNLQNDYDVQIAKRDLGKSLDRIETVNKPKAA
jgi:plasmid maintenance system antidote protein VapI